MSNDNLTPCPICQSQPTFTYWNGMAMLNCYGVAGDKHNAIGTQGWAGEANARAKWNAGVAALRPILEGDIYPCPVCGHDPLVTKWESWAKVGCCYSHSEYGFRLSDASGFTPEEAIRTWNETIERITKGLARKERG